VADRLRQNEEVEERVSSAFADWAERHHHVANAMAGVFMAAPFTAAVALSGEPTGTVAFAFLGITIVVYAFFELASRLAGRPVLPRLLGDRGDGQYDDHGGAGQSDGWSGGDGGGDGGGGG
jgi:uncharacterized membrane protein YgcG